MRLSPVQCSLGLFFLLYCLEIWQEGTFMLLVDFFSYPLLTEMHNHPFWFGTVFTQQSSSYCSQPKVLLPGCPSVPPFPVRHWLLWFSDFYFEYFPLAIPLFVLSSVSRRKRTGVGMVFIRKRKIFFSACVFRSCDTHYILATVWEVRQCFGRIKASLTVAS